MASVAEEIRKCAVGTESATLYRLKRPDVVLIDLEMKDEPTLRRKT